MTPTSNPAWENPFPHSAAQAAEVERRVRTLQSVPGRDYSSAAHHTERCLIALSVWERG